MNELLRCRAMEELCRTRAAFFPDESWKWFAEAEMWNHKAFECCNQLGRSKAATSQSSAVGEKASSGRPQSSSCQKATKIRREAHDFEILEEGHRRPRIRSLRRVPDTVQERIEGGTCINARQRH